MDHNHQLQPAAPSATNPLRRGIQPPSISDPTELERMIGDGVKRKWPAVFDESVHSRVSISSEERSNAAEAKKALWETWEAFRSGATPAMLSWPQGLGGLVSALDGWREDLGAWRLNEALKDQAWVESVLEWVIDGKMSGPRPIIPLPHYPCEMIPEWLSETTWLGLMPAPGLTPAWAPTVLSWQVPGDVTLGFQRLESPEGFCLVAGLGNLLWAPMDEDRQRVLLEMAHLQRAAMLAFPILTHQDQE